MFLKQEFWRTAEKMGLEDNEIDLAAIIWQKCELAMQGKTQQTPALLIPESKWLAQESSELTQADIQMLIAFLQRDINWLHGDKIIWKKYIAELHNLCNPEDKSEHMQMLFKRLNSYKSDIRRVKSKYNRLSAVQKKLKKLRAG